jgi:hypothetical protein
MNDPNDKFGTATAATFAIKLAISQTAALK